MKSLAHPGWPYTGSPHEWRGCGEEARLQVRAEYYRAKMEAALELKPGTIAYEKKLFATEQQYDSTTITWDEWRELVDSEASEDCAKCW